MAQKKSPVAPGPALVPAQPNLSPAQPSLSIVEAPTAPSPAPAKLPIAAREAALAPATKRARKPAAKLTAKTAPKPAAKPAAKLTAKPAPKPAPKVEAKAPTPAPTPTPTPTVPDVLGGYEDLTALGRQNVEACAACGAIMGKGMEALGKEVMALAQSALEANLTAAEHLLGAGTLREALDLQADLHRRNLDRMLAGTAKLTGLSFDLAGEVIEPVQDSVGRTARTLFKPLAA